VTDVDKAEAAAKNAAASAVAAEAAAKRAEPAAKRAEDHATKAQQAEGAIDAWAERIETTKSIYEFGKLTITSLVTTSAGLLIALAALTGSLDVVPVAAADSIKCAAVWIGLALGFSLLSAMSAYANQLMKTDGKMPWYRRWTFLVLAIGAAGLALISLAAGGVAGRDGLSAALDAKAPTRSAAAGTLAPGESAGSVTSRGAKTESKKVEPKQAAAPIEGQEMPVRLPR
jgi:hypothetical protein